MMRPLYAVLRHSYPTRDQYPRGRLLQLLGWNDLLDNHAFYDTCAMRLSAALALSGVALTGPGMKGKAGQLTNKRIEIRQASLARTLRRMWGEPEKFRGGAAARAGIGKRSGVVSFFRVLRTPGQARMQLNVNVTGSDAPPPTRGFVFNPFVKREDLI